MTQQTARTIHIAAALIHDRRGRLLLVRKAGTRWFMQAGGKIEPGEAALAALQRELLEEISLSLDADHARHLGCFTAPAANEIGCVVEAEVFHVRLSSSPIIRAEIEEAIWVDPTATDDIPLAPLTRDHILPLSLALISGRGA